MLSASDSPSHSNIYITLYRNREDAKKGFSIDKDKSINRPQVEIKNNINDMIFVSKVSRLRDSDFGGIFKTNQYHSEVIILKNNMVISIYCFAYNDNTGSSKQALIDITADYLEKCAAKEN